MHPVAPTRNQIRNSEESTSKQDLKTRGKAHERGPRKDLIFSSTPNVSAATDAKLGPSEVQIRRPIAVTRGEAQGKGG